MWSCVGTLGQLLAIAAIVSCRLPEVCKEGCVEGQSCIEEHRNDLQPAAAETLMNGQQPSCDVCTDCPNPLNISLGLNTELLHYSQTQFGITVTWKPLENVTGFSLILTDSFSTECTILYNHQCASLPPDAHKFNFTYFYKHRNPDHKVRPHLYVKLIAVFQNGCSTAEKLVIVPRNCHTLHPGDCQLCGKQIDSLDVPKAGNIAVTPLLSVAESTWEAFVSWNTSRPCPLCFFYLTIRQQPGDVEVTPRLKVVGGRTNVSLHNLEVQQTYSVEIRQYDCMCGRQSNMVEFSFVSASSTAELTASSAAPVASAPVASAPVTSAPVTSALVTSAPVTSASLTATPHPPTHPVPNSHTVTPTSSNPLDRTVTSNPLSSKMMLSSQQYSPAPSQTTTTTGQFMVLYPAVGVGVAIVITIIILAGVIVTVILLVRRSPRDINFTDSKHELGVAHHPEDIAPPPVEHLHPSHRDGDGENIKNISYPLTPPPTPPPDFPDPPPLPLGHTVLLVYSSSTPENQQHTILRLMSRLQDPYGITVHCSQMKLDRKRLVEWVPHMTRECSAVVCICNKQFYSEWEGAACNGSPVHFLKEVINGIVSAGESEAKLSKFAVVYTQQRYVPQYLLSCEKHYLQSKIEEKIARFIKQIPEYQL